MISVLKIWNQVTTAQAHGNGFVIGQTVLTIEYWHLALQLACALGYALNRHVTNPQDMTGWDTILEATRSVAFLAGWTRVLVHALFLNMLDEMNHLHVFDKENRSTTVALART